MLQTYKHALRARGVKPLRGTLRTVRQDGHVELLPGGGSGQWQDGALVRREGRS